MLRYITKDQYFDWIERFASMRSESRSASINNLKDIQDHYAISRLSEGAGLRVLEVGGGDCRVLRGFANRHECWNAEKFEGVAIGPKKEVRIPGVKNVLTYLGDYSPEIPAGYFDVVFSISVVEHVENDRLPDFFKDIARVLKPGGITFHAIDLYVFDQQQMEESFAKYARKRLELYLNIPQLTGGELRFAQEPSASGLPLFSCAYATNADREMLAWNRVVPQLKHIRAVSQSVSLAGEWIKVSGSAG